MGQNVLLKTVFAGIAFVAGGGLLLWVLSGFGDRPRKADDGIKKGILHIGNGTEPAEIDPHLTTGVQEFHIQLAVCEGLVSEDPKTLAPVPGVAKSWDISEDGKVYTFHLRDANWSNGDPVTAEDFELSFKRALMPKLANEYAQMLYVAEKAEEFYKGEVDWEEVGYKAVDEKTFQVNLKSPLSYFLSLLNHHSFFPVHIPTVLKHGEIDSRATRWTRPGNFVGNGPFVLDKWVVNHVLTVKKNPHYWDAENVRLNEIHFYPIENLDTEDRSFRAGQIHRTNKLPLSKIPFYIKERTPELVIAPYLGTYHYMFNTKLPGLDNKKVRKALNLSVDREAITRAITGGGEAPAFSFVPPNCAGYNSTNSLGYDVERARELLAEAGYPDGKGFPKFEILYNTLESHKTIAEAIQQMWKKNLNIELGLRNEEWKVYLSSKTQGNFQMVRFGWIGDYVDPNTFLELYTSHNGNNNSGWANAEYDALIAKAEATVDTDARYAVFQEAEKLLLEEAPILPIYYYMSTYLLDKRVKGWYPNLLDHHPYKYVYFEE